MNKNSLRIGVNVIGYASSNAGIGVSARNVIRLLLTKGHAVSIFDVDPGMERAAHDTQFQRYAVKSTDDLPHSVNLFCLPLEPIPEFILKNLNLFLEPNRLNVALIYWELTVLPKVWIKALECFDVILAPSEFIRAVLAAHLSNVLIVGCNLPVYMPPVSMAVSSRYGLPDESVRFVMSFDAHSDSERKNPFGTLEAFQRAFDGKPEAHLLIKLNHSIASETLDPLDIIARLKERATKNKQVFIVAESLSYQEVLGLYESSDVFVSLHRSEGFGLGPFEAMALGKPVIATAWSGNMTVMDHTNSCLVGYELTPVRGNVPVYQPNYVGRIATWAEPDTNQAAAWMRRLVNSPELRRSIGKSAAEAVAEYQRKAELGLFLDEIKSIYDRQPHLSRRNEERLEKVNHLRQALLNFYDSFLPSPRRFQRRVRTVLDKHLLWRFKSKTESAISPT